MKKVLKIIGLVFLGLIILVLAIPKKEKPFDLQSSRKFRVVHEAHKLIEEAVKVPSSLVLKETYKEIYLVQMEADSSTYTLNSTFEAQNAFGAQLRNSYTFQVKFVDSLNFVPTKFEVE